MPRLLRRRRTIAVLLLTAFVVAATGVPLSMPRVTQRSLGRFPCENCGCGCSSAEVCWTNCCCNTMQQRLAWAKRENVRPPDEALALAQKQGHDVSRWLNLNQIALNLSGSAAPAESSVKKSCCCCCKAKAPAPDKSPEADNAPPLKPTWRAMACQGALKFWLSISVATDGQSECTSETPRCVPAPTAYVADLSSVALSPPTPPPERYV